MKVITATEEYESSDSEISVFLAGGITNCWDWQSSVIGELSKKPDTDNLVVYNPRRENFPIGDPNAAPRQIEWEYKYLHQSQIFSMYFTAGESTQPICMYELGVHLTRRYLDDLPASIIVSIEDGYVRAQDVVIQTRLAGYDKVKTSATAESHANDIYNDYLFLDKCKKGQI